jgi:hypothetical protein
MHPVEDMNQSHAVASAERLRTARARLHSLSTRAASARVVPVWKLAHAQEFVTAVIAACGSSLTPQATSALMSGPDAVAEMRAEAEREAVALASVDRQLAVAEWRLRCERLRLQCLAHVLAIFTARRGGR